MPGVRVGEDGEQFSVLFQVEEEGGRNTVFFHCVCSCVFVTVHKV